MRAGLTIVHALRESRHLKWDGCCVRVAWYHRDHLLERPIQPPASVGTEMWASITVQSTDPYSTSIPLFPPARLP